MHGPIRLLQTIVWLARQGMMRFLRCKIYERLYVCNSVYLYGTPSLIQWVRLLADIIVVITCIVLSVEILVGIFQEGLKSFVTG